MKKYKWLIIILNLVVLLFYFNYSVMKKEELLRGGQLVLLELAPVDPRSLMQGDYMALRYKISENIDDEKLPKRGYMVVRIDSLGVAERARFLCSTLPPNSLTLPLKEDEAFIKYSASDGWNVNIGAESFFFQEGHAEKYEKAKYGGLKIDKKGNSLLIGLYDENRQKIE